MNDRSLPRRAHLMLVAATLLATQLVIGLVLVCTAGASAPTASPLRIAVVGDSYAAGIQNRVVWPTLLAQRTGWSVSNFALPASGFAADGQGGQAFTYQVDRAQASDPRVILIVGGLADAGSAEADPITFGAIDAINKVKRTGRQALVIGPTWYEVPVPASVRRVAFAVEQAATDAGVPYLDALDPPWLSRAAMRPDLSGPTDDGQSLIADRIGQWLQTRVSG